MGALEDLSREELEYLIEEKILELAEDPDKGLDLKPAFAKLLRERQKQEEYISHDEILKDFGCSDIYR